MHGHTAPRPVLKDPVAARIVALTEEYLAAPPGRRDDIGQEIAALIAGRVVPFPLPDSSRRME